MKPPRDSAATPRSERRLPGASAETPPPGALQATARPLPVAEAAWLGRLWCRCAAASGWGVLTGEPQCCGALFGHSSRLGGGGGDGDLWRCGRHLWVSWVAFCSVRRGCIKCVSVAGWVAGHCAAAGATTHETVGQSPANQWPVTCPSHGQACGPRLCHPETGSRCTGSHRAGRRRPGLHCTGSHRAGLDVGLRDDTETCLGRFHRRSDRRPCGGGGGRRSPDGARYRRHAMQAQARASGLGGGGWMSGGGGGACGGGRRCRCCCRRRRRRCL